MSQTDILLTHLRTKGSITQLEAIGVHRIFNLKGRINDLRKRGHDIVTEMKLDTTGKRYAEYRLVSPAAAAA